MPYAYDPDSAITYAGDDIDAGTFALQAEDFLLVHSCTRKASVGETKREIGQLVTRPGGGGDYTVEAQPRCLFRADIDQQLEFSVQATALKIAGLANYHPGLGLDVHSVAFINGEAAELPYGFTGGEWIYMDPEQDCTAGDMTEVSFRIVREFAELDPAWEPESAPVSYVLIPAQSNLDVVNTSLLNALLLDVFHNVAAFSNSPFTATLYYGDPASGGAALTDPLQLPTGWTTVIAHPSISERKSVQSNEINWPVFVAQQTVTHVRFSRNSYHVDLALAASIVVPSGKNVRAVAGAFTLSVPWQFPAGMSNGDTSAWMTKYFTGGNRITFIPNSMDFEFEALATSTPVASFSVSRNNSVFLVTGTEVTFAAYQDLVQNTSGSTWVITSFKVSVNESPSLAWFIADHSVSVANNNYLSFDGSTPVFNLLP